MMDNLREEKYWSFVARKPYGVQNICQSSLVIYILIILLTVALLIVAFSRETVIHNIKLSKQNIFTFHYNNKMNSILRWLHGTGHGVGV